MWISKLKKWVDRKNAYQISIQKDILEQVSKQTNDIFCSPSSWVSSYNTGVSFNFYAKTEDGKIGELISSLSISLADWLETNLPFPPKIRFELEKPLEEWIKEVNISYFLPLPFVDLTVEKFKVFYKEVIIKDDWKAYVKDFKFKDNGKVYSFPWYSDIIIKNMNHSFAVKNNNQYIVDIDEKGIVVLEAMGNGDIDLKKVENLKKEFSDINQEVERKKIEYNVNNKEFLEFEKVGYNHWHIKTKFWIYKDLPKFEFEQDKTKIRFQYIPRCIKFLWNGYWCIVKRNNDYSLCNSLWKIIKMDY